MLEWFFFVICKLYAIRIVFIYWFSFLPFLYQITLSMIVIDVYYDVWITWDTLGCVNTFVVFTLLVFSIVTIEYSVVRGVLCVSVLRVWMNTFVLFTLLVFSIVTIECSVVSGVLCVSVLRVWMNTFVVFTLLVFSIVTIECSVVRGVICVSVLGYGWIRSSCLHYLYFL